MRPFLCLLFLTTLPSAYAHAQWADDFTDGDLTTDPAWTGDLDRWAVALVGGGLALVTRGDARSDTLTLATPSETAFGTWSLRWRAEGVNLSTFNGFRFYLAADVAGLEGPVHGYFVQLGGNNNDEVRLYRQDGDPDGGRVLLGRAAPPTLQGDAHDLRLLVERGLDGNWTVVLDDAVRFEAHDATYASSRFAGLWVKHTSSTAERYVFDDLRSTPAEIPPDVTPPAIVEATYEAPPPEVCVRFDEPLDAATILPGAFEIRGMGRPVSARVDASDPALVRLALAAEPPPGRHVLDVAGVRDGAGNAVAPGTSTSFAVPYPPAPLPDPGDVVVNEILFAPADAEAEFVELYNRSGDTFDLADLALADARSAPTVLSDTTVPFPPGTYVVLVRNGPSFARAFPGAEYRAPSPWPALNNDEDEVRLLAGTRTIDAVAYEASWGTPGVSLERKDPDGPSDHPSNFAPAPLALVGSPGGRNHGHAPDHAAPSLIFAEVVDTNQIELYFDEPLGGIDAVTVRLDGVEVSDVARTLPERLRVTSDGAEQVRGVEIEGVADLKGNVGAREARQVAGRAGPGDVVVNEVLFAPLADPYDHRPDQPEYVEFNNLSGRLLSTRGWYWTRLPDEAGDADTLRFGPDLGGVPPGGFLVVYAAGPGAEARPGERLWAAYTEPPDGSEVLLAGLPRASLALANAGDHLVLHGQEGVVLDRVRYDPAWHHPDLLDAAGVALERRSASLDGMEAGAWSSSVHPEGGTPGRANGIAFALPAANEQENVVLGPNPFSPDGDGHEDVLAVDFRLPGGASVVRLVVYDLQGRAVRTLVPALLTGPAGTVVWDGRDEAGHLLGTGPYVLHLEAFAEGGKRLFEAKEVAVLARILR